jgi:hypothetical protein
MLPNVFGAKNMTSLSSGSLSSAPNGQIAEFDVAELRKVPFQESLYLWVRGRLPSGNIGVTLAPRVYHDRPDYWGIEVAIVNTPDAANDAGGIKNAEPGFESLVFERSVPLDGITGSRGITVIGANQIKRIEISGESL